MRHTLIDIKLSFIRGSKAVHQAVDFVGRGGGHNVGIAAAVDNPAEVGKSSNADVLGGRTAERHLVEPDIGAVAEVESLL